MTAAVVHQGFANIEPETSLREINWSLNQLIASCLTDNKRMIAKEPLTWIHLRLLPGDSEALPPLEQSDSTPEVGGWKWTHLFPGEVKEKMGVLVESLSLMLHSLGPIFVPGAGLAWCTRFSLGIFLHFYVGRIGAFAPLWSGMSCFPGQS